MSAPGGPFAEGLLVQAMWQYAAFVLRPTQVARQQGLWQRSVTGEPPEPTGRGGLGPKFSLTLATSMMLDEANPHLHLVEEFYRMGETYEAYVRPFSTPIMDEAVSELSRYMRDDWRLLDAGCGSGR